LAGRGTRRGKVDGVEGAQGVQVRPELIGVLREGGQDSVNILASEFHLVEHMLQYVPA
jgi:hypothetical protein